MMKLYHHTLFTAAPFHSLPEHMETLIKTDTMDLFCLNSALIQSCNLI